MWSLMRLTHLIASDLSVRASKISAACEFGQTPSVQSTQEKTKVQTGTTHSYGTIEDRSRNQSADEKKNKKKKGEVGVVGNRKRNLKVKESND